MRDSAGPERSVDGMANPHDEDAATTPATSMIQAPTDGYLPGRDHLEDGGPPALAVRDEAPVDSGV